MICIHTPVLVQNWGLKPMACSHVKSISANHRFIVALDRISARYKASPADLRLQVAGSLARGSKPQLKAAALKIMARLASADPRALWSEVSPQLPALLGKPPVSVQNSALQLCKQLMQTANLTAQQASSPWQCLTQGLTSGKVVELMRLTLSKPCLLSMNSSDPFLPHWLCLWHLQGCHYLIPSE